MLINSDSKTLKLKKVDIICKAKWQNKKAVCWKDKKQLYLLTNMHNPPPTGHFVEGKENVSKPPHSESYNNSTGFDDMSYMTVNSYSISCDMQKWPKNLFFHLADLTIQNTSIIHKSCAGNHTHTNCSKHNLYGVLSRSWHDHLQLDFKTLYHWPGKSHFWRCYMFPSTKDLYVILLL